MLEEGSSSPLTLLIIMKLLLVLHWASEWPSARQQVSAGRSCPVYLFSIILFRSSTTVSTDTVMPRTLAKAVGKNRRPRRTLG